MIYRKINFVECNRELLQSILKWLRTELAYTSNNIEGNTLTREETALTIVERLHRGAESCGSF